MSFPSLPNLPEELQPSYVLLSRAADRETERRERIPRWRWLKRHRSREQERVLALASAFAYLDPPHRRDD